MKKINKHIEIVSSTSRGLSSMSLKSREAICNTLRKHYVDVGITIVNSKSDLDALVQKQPNLVFLGMKSIPNESTVDSSASDKIWLGEYLAKHGIASTGSDRSAQAIEQDKPLAKQRVSAAGLQTSPYFVVKQNSKPLETDIELNYPLFVKPTNRGGGLGIDNFSVVNNFEQLLSKTSSISNKFQSDSLVEEFLPGREISVAVLKGTDHVYEAMLIERIVPPNAQGNRILSPDLKHQDAGLSVAVYDEPVRERVETLALAVFDVLGARDYGRVDIRLDKSGVPHFLEANLIPGLIEGNGNFPKSCLLNKNVNYEQMLLRIVELGFARSSNITTREADFISWSHTNNLIFDSVN